jgi:hypothetical protein
LSYFSDSPVSLTRHIFAFGKNVTGKTILKLYLPNLMAITMAKKSMILPQGIEQFFHDSSILFFIFVG